jgi:hypothetical protein
LLHTLCRTRQSSLQMLVGLALLAMMCVMSAGAVYADCQGNGSFNCVEPNTAATPELDSLFLFGTGVAGFASYAALRIRARRR